MDNQAPRRKRTVTARMLAANRANAKKSTGPRTREGKLRSRHNAVTHGITAATPLFPGEDPVRIAGLIQAYRDHHAPATETELALTDAICLATYRAKNAVRYEASLIRECLQQHEAEFQAALPGRDGIVYTAMAYRRLSDASSILESVGRYESRQRGIARRLTARLRRIQQERLGRPVPKAGEADEKVLHANAGNATPSAQPSETGAKTNPSPAPPPDRHDTKVLTAAAGGAVPYLEPHAAKTNPNLPPPPDHCDTSIIPSLSPETAAKTNPCPAPPPNHHDTKVLTAAAGVAIPYAEPHNAKTNPFPKTDTSPETETTKTNPTLPHPPTRCDTVSNRCPDMSHSERIQQLVAQKPGLKAQQIAAELGLDRSQVAVTLQDLLGGALVQDNAYRWWPTAADPRLTSAAQSAPRTFLSSLCRYYLECLSRESGSGISLPVTANGTDWVELSTLPFASGGAIFTSDRAIRKLVQRVRREPGQLTLYIGYAIRVRTAGFEGESRLEPVLLYPVEDTPEGVLRPATATPLFNLEVLKSLPAADSGNVIDEAAHLADELGLAGIDDDLPHWDEIIPRLWHCRPEWDWREPLNPYALTAAPSYAELRPGIYNRAILFTAARSPFTYGLEIELRKLAQLDDESLRDTALAGWLRGDRIAAVSPDDHPLLEVIPLNTEQRQAVLQGLTAPLTVVTGPPGTGKSQVVVSLLVNAAWQGQSAMFSSKNNHAVDVVESRVNVLGSHPLLLRLGKEEHQARLAQQLGASLAESATHGDTARYDSLAAVHEQDRTRFAAVQGRISAAVAQRNRVDEAERAAEPLRAELGASLFAKLRDFDTVGATLRLGELTQAIQTAKSSATGRAFWDSGKDRRYKSIADLAAGLGPIAEIFGIALPEGEPGEHTLPAWQVFHETLASRLAQAETVRAYWSALAQLQSATPLQELALELSAITSESARNSLELWKTWLRLWPARQDPERRKLLSEYVSLLQMIATGDRYDEGAGRKVFRRYYQLFPQVTKALPCWAVTSLSARGRLPFGPAIFDLAVIDEASQCDIASALPLLYRARRAVVIGDPLQLKHVATVAPQEDRLILANHGLAEGQAAWAYSVNSLFDRARGQCRHEDIVNLRDHHRSHRDIISFSNHYFYRDGLRIATDHAKLKRPPGPAVQWIDVKGKVVRPTAGGALNTAEAEAVVACLRKLVVEDQYDGAIGVVTPFRAQANRIRTLVHQDPELARQLAALQFVVDTVHGFQGDERDAMIFSPVVSAGMGDSALRFLKSHGNLFNVAITRARSELTVVGDLRAAADSGVSYLSSFAAYWRDLAGAGPEAPSGTSLGPEYPAVTHPELVSDWERVFYKAMYAAGLRPVPQYQEAPYTLDFALFHGDRKLDIEVDGEHYHRNWDGETCRRDQIRSRRLADAGWDVLRFWVYEIRDGLDQSVAKVKAWTTRRPVD